MIATTSPASQRRRCMLHGFGGLAFVAALLAACTKTSSEPPRPGYSTSIEPVASPSATTGQSASPSAPVATDEPNVPEHQPAFPQQTRAPEVHTRTRLDVYTVAAGFDKPWALAFLPDRRMLVTEKHSGKLYIVDSGGQKSAPASGMPEVDGRDQGGLLDVEVAPDHERTQRIYFSYYEPREGGNGLAVASARLLADTKPGSKPIVEDVRVIFRMQPTLDSTKHAGGRIVIAPDGNLFVALGERSILEGRKQARDLASDFGKIVRIAPDGTIPRDNPFQNRAGARPEIWSSGHRNILSAALDEQKRLWIVEMGPRGGDELNLVQRGKDYGWPTIGYGEEYSGEPIHEHTQLPGLEQPVYYWDPVISPSGLTIYSGALISEWKGNLLIGGLSSKALVRVVLDGERVSGEERLLTQLGARIREVVEGPEGALYLLTDDSDGKLLRVTPAPT